tara:strand:+ start:696 stop:1073 length:378 start_codon:yes stop_codon:yes gene_type:complete
MIGISCLDTAEDARYLVDKILNLRIFPSKTNDFDHSALDANAGILIVSQFTLYARTRKGRRPDFTAAAPAQYAEHLYNQTVEMFRQSTLKIATGQFGEHMQVTLQNDGPLTLMLDSADRKVPRRS